MFIWFLSAAVNCTDPPVKPDAGTWEWDGSLVYDTSILYTCGPVGSFKDPDTGFLYEDLFSTCAWNKTWAPPQLDPCAATACQEIPFPPRSIGLEYVPDPLNPISLASQFSQYNPKLPFKMKFPGPDFCGDNNQKLMIVGRIPEDGKELPEFAFLSEGIDEAFHLQIDPDNEFLARWAVVANVTTSVIGEPGDGTTIDRDEPFVIRCVHLLSYALTKSKGVLDLIFVSVSNVMRTGGV